MTNDPQRLESWKEIAAYLQRDVRTAKRWEKSEGLPVHRHRHLARSSVYAFPGELDAWRQARRPGPERAAVPRSWWRRPMPSLAFSLLILLSLLLAGDAGPGVIKARAQSLEGALVAKRLWAEPGVDASGALSPDGRHLTYAHWQTGDLGVRDLTTGQNRRITADGSWNVPDGRYAYWSTVSPDGAQAAYTWSDGTSHELRLVGIERGEPRVLYRNEELSYIRPSGWSADGKLILTMVARRVDNTWQLGLVTVADGSLRVLKSLEWRKPAIASLSPDGRYVVYDAPSQSNSAERDIWLLAADGTSETLLVKNPAIDWGPLWTPDGRRVVFVSNRAGSAGLWAVEVADGRLRGEAELLKSDVGDIWPLGISRKGSLYYGVRGMGTDIFVAEFDPATGGVVGAPKQLIDTFVGRNSNPAWSPDGKSLAYVSNREPGVQRSGSRLVIRSIETGEERTLPWHPQHAPQPRESGFAWSPDARYLAIGSTDPRGRWGVFRIDTRSGETVAMEQSTGEAYRPVWSRDGKVIFYLCGRRDEKTGSTAVVRRQIETGQERELARVPFRIRSLALSPDGRQLAFAGGFAVSFLPSDGGERREVRVANEGQAIQASGLLWTPDGRHVLFALSDPAGVQPFELYRLRVDGDRPQKVGLTMRRMWALSMSPDGRQIAFSALRPGAPDHHELWVLENLFAAPRSSGTTQ